MIWLSLGLGLDTSLFTCELLLEGEREREREREREAEGEGEGEREREVEEVGSATLSRRAKKDAIQYKLSLSTLRRC